MGSPELSAIEMRGDTRDGFFTLGELDMTSQTGGGSKSWAWALVAAVAFAAGGAAGDQEYSSVMAWDKLQMYERGDSGKLRHRTYDPDKKEWTKWDTLGDKEISSSPSALMTDGGDAPGGLFPRHRRQALPHLPRQGN